MTTSRAILQFTLSPKTPSRTVYTRRMYAIIRKYTPAVAEGGANQCFADITGMRTFLKMTYTEIAQKIQKELVRELGVPCVLRIASEKSFTEAKAKAKKPHNVSTYKELNGLFQGSAFIEHRNRTPDVSIKRTRLTVPFIGKVS